MSKARRGGGIEGCPSAPRSGQALAELVIALVVILTLVTGVSTLATLCMRRQHLRRDIRAEAGREALGRATHGWAETTLLPESRSDPFHRINAYARLDGYSPALASRLPSSNYTLAARDLPEEELGLRSVQRDERISLDAPFAQLIYPKGSVRFREEVALPAASGLWK